MYENLHLSNSSAVIIGAIIIAPLMLPIRGLAFAALEGNMNLKNDCNFQPKLPVLSCNLEFYILP